MRPRILLAEPKQLHGPEARAVQRDRLAAEFPGWQVDEAEAVDASTAYPWHEVQALTCVDFPSVGVAALPGLRLVQAVTTGVERLRLPELDAAGVRVCNGAGTAAREIAEFAIARILEDAKRLRAAHDAQSASRWHPVYGESLRGAELLLVGFGAINRAVAELAAAFGMTVRVARRSDGGPLPDGVVEQAGLTDLGRLLAGARHVVCALPEAPATMGLLDAAAIAQIADGALLINVGRGSLVDEAALGAACATGRIRAALDVFDVEPLPERSPLWTTPGVVVSAHCSSVPERAMGAVADLFVLNLHRLLAGTPLINQVAGPTGPIKEFAMTNAPSGIEAYQLGRTYDVMPIPMVPEHCVEIPAGPVLFIVESRNLSDEAINVNALDRGRPDQTFDTGIDDGGACVHVLGTEDRLEWLRFDCFDNEPHYHYVRNHEQNNQVVRFDQFAEGDPEAWTLQRLRDQLPEMLRYAGAESLAEAAVGTDLAPAIDEVAAVLARLATINRS